jgi:hypothetical protein
MKPPSSDLNGEPLDSLDVDERPPLITKLAKCSTSCSIVTYIFYGEPTRVYSYKHIEIACHVGKPNKSICRYLEVATSSVY